MVDWALRKEDDVVSIPGTSSRGSVRTDLARSLAGVSKGVNKNVSPGGYEKASETCTCIDVHRDYGAVSRQCRPLKTKI